MAEENVNAAVNETPAETQTADVQPSGGGGAQMTGRLPAAEIFHCSRRGLKLSETARRRRAKRARLKKLP